MWENVSEGTLVFAKITFAAVLSSGNCRFRQFHLYWVKNFWCSIRVYLPR